MLAKEMTQIHVNRSARYAGLEDTEKPVSRPSPGGRLKKRARVETEAGNGLEDMEDEPQVVSSHHSRPEMSIF